MTCSRAFQDFGPTPLFKSRGLKTPSPYIKSSLCPSSDLVAPSPARKCPQTPKHGYPEMQTAVGSSEDAPASQGHSYLTCGVREGPGRALQGLGVPHALTGVLNQLLPQARIHLKDVHSTRLLTSQQEGKEKPLWHQSI